LLYYFRQVNNINIDLFVDHSKVDLSDTQIKRYIYIDDMSITGKQVCEYAKQIYVNIVYLSKVIQQVCATFSRVSHA
jgi:hypothetical protein